MKRLAKTYVLLAVALLLGVSLAHATGGAALQFQQNGYGAQNFQQFGVGQYGVQQAQNVAYANLAAKQAFRVQQAKQNAKLAALQAKQARAFAAKQRRQAINAQRGFVGRVLTAPFRAAGAALRAF